MAAPCRRAVGWRTEGFDAKPGPELTEAQAIALATEIANAAFANIDPKTPNADSIKGHKVNPQAWHSRKEGNRWVFVLGAKAGPNAQVSFDLSGDDRHTNVGFASK